MSVARLLCASSCLRVFCALFLLLYNHAALRCQTTTKDALTFLHSATVGSPVKTADRAAIMPTDLSPFVCPIRTTVEPTDGAAHNAAVATTDAATHVAPVAPAVDAALRAAVGCADYAALCPAVLTALEPTDGAAHVAAVAPADAAAHVAAIAGSYRCETAAAAPAATFPLSGTSHFPRHCHPVPSNSHE